MTKKLLIYIVILLILVTLLLTSETLWDDTARNIYTHKINYQVGDPITIIVDEQSALSYRSSSKSLKTFSTSISGGEITGIFNFLPQGSSQETQTGNMTDSFSINLVLQGQIETITNRSAVVRGTKTIQVNNKRSRIDISGTVPLTYIQDNSIQSRNLINPTLQLTTLLENDIKPISDQDLVKIILNPDATSDIIEVTELSEQKRQELMLQYFNSLLNVLFQ